MIPSENVVDMHVIRWKNVSNSHVFPWKNVYYN
jgi:hypothetical protein